MFSRSRAGVGLSIGNRGSYFSAMLISPETRRIECEPTAEHHHVWLDKGMVMIAEPSRFNTRQAARKAAIRAGLEVGSFEVKQCALPCRFTVKRKRKRKRKRCRHCGKVP